MRQNCNYKVNFNKLKNEKTYIYKKLKTQLIIKTSISKLQKTIKLISNIFKNLSINQKFLIKITMNYFKFITKS